MTEYFLEYVVSFRQASDILLAIGNTGSAVQRRWFGHVAASSMPDSLDKSAVVKFVPTDKLNDYLKLRHPEPELVAKLEVKHKNLQVLGSWKKITTTKKNGFSTRAGFASFVWDGEYTLPLK